MKKLIAILCIVGILTPNFNLQGYSQTLSSSLSLTVVRDSNGVYKITKIQFQSNGVRLKKQLIIQLKLLIQPAE